MWLGLRPRLRPSLRSSRTLGPTVGRKSSAPLYATIKETTERDLRQHLAKVLERLFLIDILASIGMIIAMHVLSPPHLDPFRAPSDLRRTATIWGLPWPQVMHAYHFSLITLLGTMLVNRFGLRRFPEVRWIHACRGSALIGTVLATAVMLYFALQFTADRPFTRLDQESAAIYTAYASFLLAANLLTLLVTTPFDQIKALARFRRQGVSPLESAD